MRRPRLRGKLALDTRGSLAAPLRYRHQTLTPGSRTSKVWCVQVWYIRFFVFCIKGVTLTDLQEAEKTMKTDNKGREKKEEEEKEKEKEKEKEAKLKKGEEGVRAFVHSSRPALAALMSCDIT